MTVLDQQRHDEQGHDVDHLDHGVHGGAGGVLVRVAHGVAGDRGFMGIGALAAVEAVFDGLLGVIPGAAAGGHGNGQEQAGDNGADEHATQGDWAQAGQEANDDGGKDRDQGRNHHLAQGALGDDVHAGAVLGFGGAFHDAGDFPELAPHFFHHAAGGLTHGLHAQGAEEIGQQTADEQAGDDPG